MENDEYATTQAMLVHIRRVLENLRLPEFLEAIERAQAMGPILDPTLYRRAGGELSKIRALAEHALRMRSCELPVYAEESGPQDSPR